MTEAYTPVKTTKNWAVDALEYTPWDEPFFRRRYYSNIFKARDAAIKFAMRDILLWGPKNIYIILP